MAASNIRYPERQYDIPRTHNFTIEMPNGLANFRLDSDDFVFFNYPSNFPASKYRVVVESGSNASPNHADRFRDIGQLSGRVQLPDVYFPRGFGNYAQIGVIPMNNSLPAFVGDLHRGSTYTINPNGAIATSKGHIALERTGVA